uniref:biotin/lipoyl-containing protein n=1 Tax=Actinomyces polynesiensis TaxID=1325934 RepID=UPI0005BD0119
MATAVKMPALGESVTEGTVTTWLKKVGDTVEADEPIVEVSTDKVDSEVPSPVAGTILEILVDEDETVEVGTEIARIGDPSEATGGDSSGDSDSAPEPGPVAEATPDEPTEPTSSPAPEPTGAPASDASATEVKMPALGESVTEGTVTTWLKKVGDTVEADEPLLEVSTDKVDSEVPSPVAGTVLEILVDEDETVEVGTVLARVGDADATPAPSSAPEQPAAQETPAPESEPAPEPAPAPRAPEPAPRA